MRFVLEEASWLWDGSDRVAYIENIEQLLDRLDVARERGESFAASRVLLDQTVYQSHKLSDLLWDRDSPLRLAPEIRQRVDALFGAIRYWDDERDWPDIDATIAGRTVVSPSAALAHSRVVQGDSTACFPLPGNLAGPHEVSVKGVVAVVHFVVDEVSHRAFFRDALNVERVKEAGIAALAPHAFPDTFFLDGVWDGLRHFEGGYARVRDDLHRLLSVLDDFGAWVFTDTTGRLSPFEPLPADETKKNPTNQIIERRFRGFGLEIAPENPNVKLDGASRRDRERKLGSRTLYCEWHYKFEPHVNRAHLHEPVPESGGKVVMAIFRDHLKLP